MHRPTYTKSIIIKPETTTLSGATVIVGYWRAPDDCRLVGAYIVDSTAIAKSETDWMTVTVYNSGAAGSGTTSMAAGDGYGDSGNWVTAGVHTALTLSSTNANVLLTAGQIVKIVKTQDGTAVGTKVLLQLDIVMGN